MTTENLSFTPDSVAPTTTFAVAGATAGDRVLLNVYDERGGIVRSYDETEMADISGGEIVWEPSAGEVAAWPATGVTYMLHHGADYTKVYAGTITVISSVITIPLGATSLQLYKLKANLTANASIPFTFPAGTVVLGIIAKTTAAVTGNLSLDEAGGDDIVSAETLPSNASKFYLPDNAGQYFLTSGQVAVSCTAYPATGGVQITVIYTVV
jgi:hypothetical protein